MKKTKMVAAALALIMSGGPMNYVQVILGDISITAIAATPENYSDGKFNFTLYSDHAVITGPVGKVEELSGVLKIPSSAKGVPVTEIGQKAFENAKSISSVSIPDSVKKIGSFAFSRCFELVSVDMGSGLEDIYYYTFEGCMKLKNVKFSPKLKGVGGCVFDCCTSLEEVTLPASVKTIGVFAFRRCESLKSITIPNMDCTIEEHNETLGGFTEQTVICGAAGSLAQEYAKKYGYQFKAISTPAFGDFNGDGAINAIDASEILTIYTRTATNNTKPTSNELAYCDVNKDGAVNAVDASYVLSFYAYNATNKTKISFTDYMKKN